MEINYNVFDIMWKNERMGTVVFTKEEFSATMKQVFKNPFKMLKGNITREDVFQFIKEQCFDEHNACSKEILKH